MSSKKAKKHLQVCQTFLALSGRYFQVSDELCGARMILSLFPDKSHALWLRPTCHTPIFPRSSQTLLQPLLENPSAQPAELFGFLITFLLLTTTDFFAPITREEFKGINPPLQDICKSRQKKKRKCLLC